MHASLPASTPFEWQCSPRQTVKNRLHMRLTKAAAASSASAAAVEALGHSLLDLCLGLVSFPCHLFCFALSFAISIYLSVSLSLVVVEPVNARVRFLVVRLEVALPAATAAAVAAKAVQMPPPGFAVFTIFPIYLPTHSVRFKVFLKMMHPRPCSSARSASYAAGPALSPPSLFLFLSCLSVYLFLHLSWGLLLIKCVVRTTSGAHCSF